MDCFIRIIYKTLSHLNMKHFCLVKIKKRGNQNNVVVFDLNINFPDSGPDIL
jgi:hypothetical protein